VQEVLPCTSKSLAVCAESNIGSDESDVPRRRDWTAPRRCYVKEGGSNGVMFQRGQALSPDAMAGRHWENILVVASIAPETNATKVWGWNLGNPVPIRIAPTIVACRQQDAVFNWAAHQRTRVQQGEQPEEEKERKRYVPSKQTE
jgi:hypothetical protein